MNSPYLIIDRCGNAVDINHTEPTTCHNHYRTCHGCPDRVAEPRCHTTCEGYIYRSEKNKERLQAQNEAYTWVPRREWDKRTRARQEEINRRKR